MVALALLFVGISHVRSVYGLDNSATGPTQEHASVPRDVVAINAQMSETYAKVSKIGYSFRCVILRQIEPSKSEFTGTVERHSDLGYQVVQQDQHFVFTNGKAPPNATTTLHTTSYVGPTSCGSWVRHNSYATEYMYGEPATMSDEARRSIEVFRAPEPELYAFGDSREFLWDLLQRAQEQPMGYRWEVRRQTRGSEQTGADWHLLMYTTVNGTWAQSPSMDLAVDPKRGFCVTHIVERMPEAPYPIIRDINVELTELPGDRAWYPSHIVEHYYAPSATTQLLTSYDSWFDNITVRRTLTSADFSEKALSLPDATQILRYSPDGKETLLRWDAARGMALYVASGPAESSLRSSVQGMPLSSQGAVNNMHYIVAGIVLLAAAFVMLAITLVRRRRAS